MNRSLDYRKDKRTKKQFKKDIKHHTTKEACLIEIFQKEVEDLGHKIEVADNGVDNSGDLVKISSCNADYLCIIDGVAGLYEVKCSPVKNKCTFKVYNLEQYVKQNSNILLFYGMGKDPCNTVPNEAMWAVISPSKIKQMLQDKKPYKEKFFGYKPCIRIYSEDFDKYFESHEVTHETA